MSIDTTFLRLVTGTKCAARHPWTQLNLGNVCTKIGSGATPRGGKDVYLTHGPYALIRSQNVFNDGFRDEGLAYIGGTHASQLKNVEVAEGDVLLNITGDSVARACQVRPDVLPARVNQHVAIIRPDPEKLDPRFLRYALVTPELQDQLLSWAGSGGTRNALTKGMIESLSVAAPQQVCEQLAIAHILGTLDDKIELNRRMNETLEAMVRSIFKDWFVDFGPTLAKIEGRDPYLAPELWDLFPDALDDQSKPVGWKREVIGRHVVAEKGLSYKGAGLTRAGQGIPLHNLNSILEGGGYKNDGLKFYLGDYKQRHLIQPGDLIVANTEQGFDHLLIGYSSLVPAWTGEEGLFSHHLFKVEPRQRSPLSRIWLHFALSVSSFGEAMRRYSNGTTVNMLPRDALEKPEITVPPVELIQAFGKIVAPKLRRLEDTFTASQALAQTRDLLLPKLISGEIRVSQAENLAEAVT